MNDRELESAIDEIGREKVFSRARALGWGGPFETPPKWVWWNIVAEMRAEGMTSPLSRPPGGTP